MAEHLRERILESVKNTLTGLHETGMYVDRLRVYPLDRVPSINILQGNDTPTPDEDPDALMSYIDRDLHVALQFRNKAIRDIDTWLNRIAAEVTRALQADITQGLAACYNTSEGDTDAIEVSAAGEQPVVMMQMHWTFRYRTTRADPTTNTL